MHFAYEEFFTKYRAELLALGRDLRRQFHVVEQRGFGTAFSDVEGEILYMLVRETKPNTLFEISPWHGWSTNYLMAALTANERGTLHSFELTAKVGDEPIENVIRRNQHPHWDQDRLVVHVGDARDTTRGVGEQIDFLMLDSCHDGWFADWYIESLFPRTNGPLFIQDIAFFDRLEPSSEAARLWQWLERQSIRPDLIGSIERHLETTVQREGFAERRYRQSNAIVFTLPEPARGSLPAFEISVEARISEAESLIARGESGAADELLNQVVYELLRNPSKANRHRPMLAASRCYRSLGEHGEADRCLRRADAFALGGDAADRAKSLTELARTYLAARDWRRAARVLLALGWERSGLRKSLATLAAALDPRR